MAIDSNTLQAMEAAQTGIQTVIQDLQNRGDYNKHPDFLDYVQIFQAYSQNLLTAQLQLSLSKAQKDALIKEGSDTVLPIIEKLIHDNITLSQMGQLNTNRTISPTIALANNVNLQAEQSNIQHLNAQLHSNEAEPEPMPEPEPTPEPVPEPIPEPAPDPAPEPTPEPTPEPSPEPSPEPKPSTEEQAEPGGIIPETEAISRFNAWAASLGGGNIDTF